jgi:hypothetical protein
VNPGHSAVTCTPESTTSACRLWLNEVTNALVAAYVALPGSMVYPATEDTFRIPP